MPYCRELFTRVTTAWAVGVLLMSSAAKALTKPSAERNGRILVLDLGPRRGEVDPGDDLVALDRPCGEEGSRDERRRSAELAANEADQVTPIAREVLERAGLADFVFTSNLAAAYAGPPGAPVVLLYPEQHLDWNKTAPNLRLHARETAEVVRLTERLLGRGLRPVNAIEYPFGQIEPLLGLVNAPPAQRRAAARALVTKEKVSLGFAIAELFGARVNTVPVDDPDLKVRNEVTMFARELRVAPDFDPRRSYLGMLDVRLDARGNGLYVGNAEIYAYFNDVLGQTPAEIARADSRVCEERSRQMANQTVKAAGAMAYLQLGASHVYGVTKRLRELGVSYLILSP